jgi:hypothetical protein
MRKEDLRDWLGLHRREKKEKGYKRNRGAKAFNGEDCLGNGKVRGSTRIVGYV